MNEQISSATDTDMVRNYENKSSRGAWSKESMASALENVKEGRMSCLAAANAFDVPEATLRRRLKKNENEMPVHLGRFREVFSAEQQEDLKSYFTAMDEMFFGLTKKQCRRLVFDFAEECKISHPFNKDTKMAGEDWLANFMKKHKFSVRKPEATSIARAMGFNKPSVDRFFNIERELREKYKFPASSILNADESGLSTVPNKLPMVISLTGSRSVSKIVTAERGRNVTIICCISATGFYLPPFLIFARKRMLPELVERAPPGTAGHCSDNGWSNEGTFSSFLKHFYLHVKPNKESPALLILDNHKSHITLEAILYCREKNIIMVGLPPPTSHRLQPLDVSFFGPLKTYYSQACDNFMVTHPGQAITDKNIGELLSTAYFKAATVGNAVNGFKECGIEPYNPLVFSEHDFGAAKTTDHDVVSDENENNSASPQTLVVENQQINPIEEPEDIENAESDAPKMPVSVFDFKPLPKAKQCEKKRKSKKMNSSILTSTPVKDMLEQREKQKEEQERLKKQRKEAREAKKGVKRLKLSSCRPQSKKSRPNSAVASTSKNGVTRSPAYEEEYCDPPTEEWIQCSKCQEWWHEECSNYESDIFICDLC